MRRELITIPSLNSSETEISLDANLPTLQAIASIHVIDQGIKDIAKEFRFTTEEVQEYYDKCGEMGRTRARFQRMRQDLNTRFKDDED
jgi:hypothetical protein